jgi:hypothetical protein
VALTRKTLVCCASSYGYGPVSKLLVIAERVRPSIETLVFVGTGIAHELAARTALFDEVIHAPADDRRIRRVVASGNGLLSVMDRQYFRVALDLSVPLYAVDSLFWLREPVPEALLTARRAWVQDFDWVRERLRATGVGATVVGPIVRPGNGRPARSDRLLVVNLGGGEAPHGSLAVGSSYPDLVVRAILDSDWVTGFDGATVLMAGSPLIERLGRTYKGCGIDFRSVAHDEALALLGEATLVLTSPGLTTSLECFQMETPTFFLPPQNSSQWWILKAFRGQDLAPAALHWEDLDPSLHVPRLSPQDVRDATTRRVIAALGHADATAARLVSALAEIPRVDHGALAARQRQFFDSLGANGAVEIARSLAPA